MVLLGYMGSPRSSKKLNQSSGTSVAAQGEGNLSLLLKMLEIIVRCTVLVDRFLMLKAIYFAVEFFIV